MITSYSLALLYKKYDRMNVGSDRLHFTQKEEGRVGVCVWWQRWDRRRQQLSGRAQGASACR